MLERIPLDEIYCVVNCTTGTDTTLITSDSNREVIYSVSGLKPQIINEDKRNLCMVRGDRWNAFSTEGPILTGYRVSYSLFKFWLGSEKYIHGQGIVNKVLGRLCVTEHSVSQLDAGQGKLVLESFVE